ncbi:MAG: DUF2752 domain-containing protein [Planctomycetota bacterium]
MSALTRATWQSVGWTVALGYAAWNAAWLSRGTLAPSALTWLTDVPSPTTGGTRAMLALWHGDAAASLALHPLALPILGLLVATLARLAWLVWRRQPVRLHARWVSMWGAVLGAAWVVQLANPAIW